MNHYALYLRKSRADVEAEARGEGETLAKHRRALTDMANRRGLFIVREYAELVSGDTIAARPQMQQLLEDVKAGLYAGVIVNDVDRLGRGDGIDQEIIKVTFAAVHCLIITPLKDIDFSNTGDEDMYDFKAFFARQEYKIISRRMMQGRIRSAAAGTYLGYAPYGYRKVRNGQRVTLEPDPDTAHNVKMIFDMYLAGNGYRRISNELRAMGVKTNNNTNFTDNQIHRILTNPTYTGRVSFGAKISRSVIKDGQRVKQKQPSDPVIVENAHEAIIDDETFQEAARQLKARTRVPVPAKYEVVNPLAGLVRCSVCGKLMQTAHGRAGGHYTSCLDKSCPTVGTKTETLLEAVVGVLSEWCAVYDNEPQDKPKKKETSRLTALRRQLKTLDSRLARSRYLVETDVYTPAEYIKSRDTINAQRKAVEAEIAAVERGEYKPTIQTILPQIHTVIDAMQHTNSPVEQNRLLKTIIEEITYTKTKPARSNRKNAPAQPLILDIKPKLTRL